MKNKMILLFLPLMFTLSSYGVRHVGNGGGEAELRMLKMFNSLPLWLKACEENADICWSKQEKGREVAHALKDFLKKHLKMDLNFINAGKGKSFCTLETLNICSEELYFDPKTSKGDHELASIILRGLLECGGEGAVDVGDLTLKVLPLVKEVVGTPVGFVQWGLTDLLVTLNSKQNLHQELRSQISCNQYHILNSRDSFLQVRCEDNRQEYSVLIREDAGVISLIPRYNSDDGL
jgi:hypothetical protein